MNRIFNNLNTHTLTGLAASLLCCGLVGTRSLNTNCHLIQLTEQFQTEFQRNSLEQFSEPS